MATITFSSLPTEIQISIAEYCENNDLINLCLTSKRLKEISLPVLYRHVDLLRFDRYDTSVYDKYECYRIWDARNRQKQIVQTLLSHPEYGKHIQSFKGMLCVPISYYFKIKDPIEDEDLLCAMQSLTHVQNVDVGFRNSMEFYIRGLDIQPPSELFRSATSVGLADHMEYDLAKSILHAINPATLKHLSLDMLHDCKIAQFRRDYGVNEQITMLRSMSGLLTTLTGRCTALRTLILRRQGLAQYFDDVYERLEAAEAPNYIEWASFISSVKGTLEKFTFECSRRTLSSTNLMNKGDDFSFGPYRNIGRNMGENFRRLILPAFVSGDWPCLTFIQLRGIRSTYAQVGKDALTKDLTAALGKDVKIMVMEDISFLPSEP